MIFKGSTGDGGDLQQQRETGSGTGGRNHSISLSEESMSVGSVGPNQHQPHPMQSDKSQIQNVGGGYGAGVQPHQTSATDFYNNPQNAPNAHQYQQQMHSQQYSMPPPNAQMSQSHQAVTHPQHQQYYQRGSGANVHSANHPQQQFYPPQSGRMDQGF